MSSYRWWENYLVRYFMPSIAGVAIVSWLTNIAGKEFQQILFFGATQGELSPPILTLLILYGNLFCYIASYPILGFHVTRVIDHSDSTWHPSWKDGYLVSLVTGILFFIVSTIVSVKYRLGLCIIVIIVYAGIQLWRVKDSLERKEIRGLKAETSNVYGLAYALAKRRGIIEKTITSSSPAVPFDENEFYQEEKKEQEVSCWQKEIVDTYRHMREHGNSAFIFFLELVLSSICYIVISDHSLSAHKQVSIIGCLFAIWAIPAVSIHLLGQVMERRFSLFDRKIKKTS